MNWINAIGFNIIWFGCVFLGNSFTPIALCLLLAHLIFVNNKGKELFIIISVSVVGLFIDSLLVYFHVYNFNQLDPDPLFVILFWLIILWAAFAATINHSLSFINKYTFVKFLAGLLVVPLSYLAGNNFHAVEFGYSVVTTFFILSLTWGMLIPLLFSLSNIKVLER